MIYYQDAFWMAKVSSPSPLFHVEQQGYREAPEKEVGTNGLACPGRRRLRLQSAHSHCSFCSSASPSTTNNGSAAKKLGRR